MCAPTTLSFASSTISLYSARSLRPASTFFIGRKSEVYTFTAPSLLRACDFGHADARERRMAEDR